MFLFGKVTIALLFLAAGALKLQDVRGFSAGVASFEFFPSWSISAIAHTLPILEIIAGISLFAKRTQSASLLIFSTLSVSFATLYGIAILRHIQPNCGCFSNFLQVTPSEGMLRAVALSLLTITLYALSHKETQTSA